MNEYLNNKEIKFLNKFYNFSKQTRETFDERNKDKHISEIFDENFKFLLDATHFNDLPKIVSNKQYKANDSTEYYRGATEYAHTAHLLTDSDFRLGQGYMGGIFACPKFLMTTRYTGEEKLNSPSSSKKVLSFKMEKNKKINKSELNDYLSSIEQGKIPLSTFEIKYKLSALAYFIESIDNLLERTRFFKLFANDPSKLAVYLGYDYIYDDSFPASKQMPNVIILNRGAMIVSKDEYDKFVFKSFSSDPRNISILEK